MSSISNSDRSKRKREERRKGKDEKLRRQYSGISFSSRESSGRPGTPHRYFESSFGVGKASTEKAAAAGQIIHRHANGLCIVTAGELVKRACEASTSDDSEDSTRRSTSIHVSKVEFLVKEVEGQSVGSKRRKKMAKQRDAEKSSSGENSGVVRPSDKLARVELSNGCSVDLDCCVLGTVLETNAALSDKPSLLANDPLLDGFLAIIMPQGPFPFPPIENSITDAAISTK